MRNTRLPESKSRGSAASPRHRLAAAPCRRVSRFGCRPAFTLVELMIVVAIIAVLLAITVTAYVSVTRNAQQRQARATLDALAAAAQAYYNETRDYPAMRLGDLSLTPSAPFASTPLPNVDQSVAALVYQLQYRSSAGDLIKNLPASVLVPLNLTVNDAGQIRPLFTVRDPWGNAIQYLRPRTVPAGNALSASSLNNRVLLVSMGPDGRPGQEGIDRAKWTDLDDGNTPNQEYPNPAVLRLGKPDDILVQVGATQ